MSLVTCSPILARACPSFRPKLVPFSIYLEFGSSDFDETFKKGSWSKENDDWWVWSHVSPFLPRHAHPFRPKLGNISSQKYNFKYISNLVHQSLMKLWGHVLGMKWMMTDEFGHNSYIINEVSKMIQKSFFSFFLSFFSFFSVSFLHFCM